MNRSLLREVSNRIVSFATEAEDEDSVPTTEFAITIDDEGTQIKEVEVDSTQSGKITGEITFGADAVRDGDLSIEVTETTATAQAGTDSETSVLDLEPQLDLDALTDFCFPPLQNNIDKDVFTKFRYFFEGVSRPRVLPKELKNHMIRRPLTRFSRWGPVDD